MAEALNVTVWLCEEVVNATLVVLAVNELIAGFSLSIFATTTLSVSVSEFPAASSTVAVKLNVLFPQLDKSE